MATTAHHIQDEPIAPKPCPDCGGKLVPTRVVPDLYVSRRGDSHPEAWSTAPLEAWTCDNCGRTDLYANDIEVLSG